MDASTAKDLYSRRRIMFAKKQADEKKLFCQAQNNDIIKQLTEQINELANSDTPKYDFFAEAKLSFEKAKFCGCSLDKDKRVTCPNFSEIDEKFRSLGYKTGYSVSGQNPFYPPALLNYYIA